MSTDIDVLHVAPTNFDAVWNVFVWHFYFRECRHMKCIHFRYHAEALKCTGALHPILDITAVADVSVRQDKTLKTRTYFFFSFELNQNAASVACRTRLQFFSCIAWCRERFLLISHFRMTFDYTISICTNVVCT